MITLLDTKTPVKQLAKRKTFSTSQALAVINHYDAEIKEAASHRKNAPPSPKETYPLYERNLAKLGSGSTLITSTAIIAGAVLGMTSDMMLFATLSLSPIALALVGIMVLPQRSASFMHKILSPVRYAKIESDRETSARLHELEEEEFSKAEAKILKKTEKAMKFLNDSLKSENKEIVYSSARGGEGFRVVDNGPRLNQWEALQQSIEPKQKLRALESAV